WLKKTRNPGSRPSTFFLARVGETVRPDEFRAAFKGTKRILRDGADPARVSDLLTQLVRIVSKRTNDTTVGREVMVTCLPSPSDQPGAVLLTSRGGEPTLTTPTFFYRRPGNDDAVAFGPIRACFHTVESVNEITYLNESGSDLEILTSIKVLPSHPMFQQPPP